MIGKTIFELDRVGSTNDYANQVLSKGELDEGTVIWAHEQFAGRGQQNHKWVSKAGKNLTFTVILKPIFLAPDQQFLLNKAVSLGVLDFIRNSLYMNTFPLSNPGGSIPFHAANIKWPNDIYLGSQKIGGILIEHKIMGSSLESSLAGIGVNINQTRFSSKIPNPVSLIHVLRNEMALKEALLSVCKCLDLRYITLVHDGHESLDQDYNKSLLGFDQWSNFKRDGVSLEGKIGGVDNLGRLLVETRSGEMLSFNHGEIEQVTYYTSSQT
ncbi:MAG: biotin--[acetyl-CoA-carboxylase] ligase [Bacteroidota bacterium]